MTTKSRIAVIDDDKPFRDALEGALDSMGYDVLGYASAEDFLALGGETLCDCIITDIHMPGMSGIDLKFALAAAGSNVPVILITGRTDPVLESMANGSGAVCLLRKPFDSQSLVHCLDLALK